MGTLLAIVSAVFLLLELRTYHAQLADIDFDRVALTGLALLVLAFASSNVFLALGWRETLSWLGATLPWGRSIKVYAASQLGKYVPGNVFQFVGRQVLGRAAGVSHDVLLRSTAIEIGLLITAGATFSPVLLEGSPLLALAIFAILGSLLGATALISKLRIRRQLVLAFAAYWGFLTCSGAVFAAIFFIVAEASLGGGAVPLLVSAYVIAWLGGLLTPGAPAGLGVRELLLTTLLADLADPATILLAVLIGRVVTVLGDVCFFVFCGGAFGADR